MAFHRNAQGDDLHRPSTIPIQNGTGSQINAGTWVNIAKDEDSNNIIQVTSLATMNTRDVALVETNLAAGAVGVGLLLGRARGINTGAFAVGDFLRLASNNTYALATQGEATIARVIVSSNTTGVLNVDTITVDINDNNEGLPSLGMRNQELRVSFDGQGLEYFTPNLLPNLGAVGQQLRVQNNSGTLELSYFNPAASGALVSQVADAAAYAARKAGGFTVGELLTPLTSFPITRIPGRAASLTLSFPTTLNASNNALTVFSNPDSNLDNSFAGMLFEVITSPLPAFSLNTLVIGFESALNITQDAVGYNNVGQLIIPGAASLDGATYVQGIVDAYNAISTQPAGTEITNNSPSLSRRPILRRTAIATRSGTSVTFTEITATAFNPPTTSTFSRRLGVDTTGSSNDISNIINGIAETPVEFVMNRLYQRDAAGGWFEYNVDSVVLPGGDV